MSIKGDSTPSSWQGAVTPPAPRQNGVSNIPEDDLCAQVHTAGILIRQIVLEAGIYAERCIDIAIPPAIALVTKSCAGSDFEVLVVQRSGQIGDRDRIDDERAVGVLQTILIAPGTVRCEVEAQLRLRKRR